MTEPLDSYRIDCPNGHPVSVPHRLVGEELICPSCNTRFEADANASVELQEARLDQAARQWLIVALAAVIVVVTAALVTVLIGLLT